MPLQLALKEVTHLMQPPFAATITVQYTTAEGEFRDEVRIRLVEIPSQPGDVDLHSVWNGDTCQWMTATFTADFKASVKELLRQYAVESGCDPAFPWLPNTPNAAAGSG
jgi:hypothetical protein